MLIAVDEVGYRDPPRKPKNLTKGDPVALEKMTEETVQEQIEFGFQNMEGSRKLPSLVSLNLCDPSGIEKLYTKLGILVPRTAKIQHIYWFFVI